MMKTKSDSKNTGNKKQEKGQKKKQLSDALRKNLLRRKAANTNSLDK